MTLAESWVAASVLRRANNAEKGRRSGGYAPYGMASDGNGSLKLGDPAKIKVVQRVFDEYVNRHGSMHGITTRLNADRIPAPRGGMWEVAALSGMLRQAAYRGDFEYGRRKSGQFYTLGTGGKTVPRDQVDTPAWVKTDREFDPQGRRLRATYRSCIWDAAQTRSAERRRKSGRGREHRYALSGILICDNCGKPMTACQHTGRHTVDTGAARRQSREAAHAVIMRSAKNEFCHLC